MVAVAGLTADRDTGAAFAVVDSFDAPTALWRVDGDRRAVVRRSRPAAASCLSLSVSQVTYPSLDGTTIGLFLIHRADVAPGPDVPAILNGYGGFAISETPVWSPQIAAWCAAGGLYAIAGLRGGLEEGEAWHHAGRRDTQAERVRRLPRRRRLARRRAASPDVTASPCSAGPTAACSSASP